MLEKIYKIVEVKSTWNISNARELKSHSELKSHITTPSGMNCGCF
jgi:hypothetical protein